MPEERRSIRRITDDDAEAIATHVVDSLMGRLTDEETVDKVLAVWGAKIDEKIGRNVRRTVFWLFMAVLFGLASQIGLITQAVKKFLGI